jgi:hypothetical protein
VCSAVWRTLMKTRRKRAVLLGGHLLRNAAYDGWLVQERFPVGRHTSRWSRSGLISRVRMRRKQLCTLDHRLLLVIEEPILTRLKAGLRPTQRPPKAQESSDQ